MTLAAWSLREVKDLFSLGPCTSMKQEGQHVVQSQRRGKQSLRVNVEPVSWEGIPAGMPGHSPGEMKITATTSQESGPGTPDCASYTLS